MELRSVGRTEIQISPIGLGCVTFGREIDEESSYRIMDYAVESGINWFDTAEAYGGGNARTYRRNVLGVDDVREVTGDVGSSELIIGRWMKDRGCRDDVVICSKVSSGSSPENIESAMNASLDRLGIDSVDIYEIHSPDANVPIDESLDALAAHVKAGRTRALGCSNFTEPLLREALQSSERHRYPRFEVLQPPYSLAAPEAENDLFPLCREQQISTTTYSPLAAGFLTGKYTPDRGEFPEGSRFHIIPGHADIYFNEDNFNMVRALRKKADEIGEPMVRLAMAWAMSNPDVTSVLVGARKTEQIDNAIEAHNLGLSPELRAEMSAWGGRSN
jgi:1-deoxyxylulose-5-phosphate synthase